MFLPALLAVTSLSFAPAEADTIYRGGSILTMSDAQPTAQAVAVASGKIIAVGSEADVLKHRVPKTRVVDLGGRTMIPGLIDAHGHVALGGLQALTANLLAPPDGEVVDMASLIRTLKDWAAKNSGVVKQANLIVGTGYDQSQLKELRHPTRDDLDTVSTEVPVLIQNQSGHLMVMNSVALRMAGVTAQTPDPEGGLIRRKAGSREPNGVLEGAAMFDAVPKLLGGLGPETLKVCVRFGAQQWASYGFTTAQEGRSSAAIDRAIRAVAAEGGLPIDVVSYPDVTMNQDYVERSHGRNYANRFRVGGGKLSTDGSPQGFTAFRDRPYYAPIGDFPPGYLGYPTVSAKDVVGFLDWGYRKGIQLIVHANGEAASDVFIAAVREAQRKHGKLPVRPVLIHGQFLREDQVDSYVSLGVIPALFPMHTFYWGDWHRDHTVGPANADNISPTGWFRQRNSIFTTHHDAPVAFPDSMRVLDATVNRRSRSGDIMGPWQRVDALTGLKAMTIWAAYQYFEEDQKGSIEVGKLADFAILSQNPTTVNPMTIASIRVMETIKEGKTIYQRTTTVAEDNRMRKLGDTFGQGIEVIADSKETNAKLPKDGVGAHRGCACNYVAALEHALATGKRSP